MHHARRRVLVGALAAVAAVSSGGAWAQNYPTKPVRLIVPFPSGGATDIFARVLSQKLGEKLGTAVVVENRPGAGGTIGSDAVARAPADGYTLLLATSSTHAVGPSLSSKTPYDVVRDFSPIAQVGNAPSIMLVPNSSPAKTVQEWIAHARKNPGKLNYASSGNGTIVQLTAELFAAQTGLMLTHIPYKGSGLAMPDLVVGNVDVMFDSLPTGLPYARDGRVRALGVTTLGKSSLAPDMPVVADTVPGFESNTWFGLYGPKGLSPEVLARISSTVNQVLAETEMRDKLLRLGIEPAGGTPTQFAQMVAADTAKWKKIITERKITGD